MGIAFGISRPPLREALKALTLMGVLASRQGGRYTVTDLSPSRLVAPFNTMLSIADYDVHQQFEARTVVDLELVRLCAERATPELRQRIQKLARRRPRLRARSGRLPAASTSSSTRRSTTAPATACCSRRWRRCSTTSASTCAAPRARCRASSRRASRQHIEVAEALRGRRRRGRRRRLSALTSSTCATPPSRPWPRSTDKV